MPNHVFAHISVEKKYADKLREISKVGLCRHYHPMPEELKDSVSGSEDSKPEWQKQKSKELIDKYGADNWYAWCVNNWGTKWGCYETQFDEDDEKAHYCFSTAWSPVSSRIMDMFMKDIPSFIYNWEEEQGFGEYHEIKDGEFIEFHEWDLPEWRHEDEYEDLYKLKKPYTKCGKTYRPGFYLDGCLESFMGDRLEDALKRAN